MTEPIKTPVRVEVGSDRTQELCRPSFLRDHDNHIVLILYGDDGEARLRQITAALNAVEKLPRTKDGVLLTQGMKVHSEWGGLGPQEYTVQMLGVARSWFNYPYTDQRVAADCYSTRAAAEAARKDANHD